MNENYTPKVGDIFEMSWGYDQTNVNFFQVTRVSSKGVFVREVAQSPVPSMGGGAVCEYVSACKDQFLTKSQWCNPRGQSFQGNVETFRKVSGNPPGFSIKGRYYARLWDNKPTYSSWGH